MALLTQWFNGAAVLAIVLLALLFASYSRLEHQSLMVAGERSAEQMAEHTALVAEGSLDTARQLLSFMAFLTEPLVHGETLEPKKIRMSLLRIKEKNPHIMDLLIVSSAGMIEYWTGDGAPPDIRDRDYYLFHTQASVPALYLGQPLLSKVHQGRWFFALSEALRDEEENLTQVLVAIIDVSMLSRLLGVRFANQGSSQALMSRDGKIYTRTPDHDSYAGKTVSRPAELASLTHPDEVLTFRSYSQLDNKQRIIALRQLTKYSMIAAGTILVDDLLVAWRREVGFLAGFWLMLSMGAALLARRSNAISRAQHELATFDSLTGIHNRGAILSTGTELKRSEEHAGSLSLLMIDADNFKEINDQFGHLVGDDMLRQLTQILKSQIRATDIAGRYGGEEFLVLLPDTGPQGALKLAEKIRNAVAEKLTQPRPITVSIGVSTTAATDVSLDRTIERADKALYRAKNAGRNCVKTG